MARMCQVSNEDKLNANLIMLSGKALVYYSSNVQGYLTYDEAATALQNWYNTAETQARILTK